MPPVAGKSKTKGGRESRRSRSRNTTPSSVGASASSTFGSGGTAYLDMPLSQLMMPTNLNYDDILERHGSSMGIPDTKHLDTLAADLRALAQLAELRGQVCDKGMRDLSHRRKERLEEEREKERENRDAEARKERIRRETVAQDAEDERAKNGKLKKRKDRSSNRESRPLAHGAHGVARQDGLDPDGDDNPSSPDTRRAQHGRAASKERINHEPASTSISSLSPSSQLQSPTAVTIAGAAAASDPNSPASSSSLSDQQPPPMPAVPQYQTFGPDPSTFDDPTIYHIREVTPGMSDDEIKQIYSVADYPHDDLHDLIPGIPPDKDFSNAKPTNQVAATTFATYIEPYFRPFTEEDLAFLRERGDRTQPLVIPRRGKKHYTEVWAGEDGTLTNGTPHPSSNPTPANQSRGNIDQITDDTAASDQISGGPMLSRLLSAMRPEHRPTPSEDKPTNGDITMTNGITNGDTALDGDVKTEVTESSGPPLPPATLIPDSTQPGWKIPTTKLEYNQVDERLKQELRYIGFLGEDSEPDYDAHYDDEIAARLRHLQAELKEQSITNGARKARIAELAKTRLAYQEYNTILEDLDNQVQQSYLKRTRTLGKGKKQQKRPGGAGGGSHFVGAGGAVGVSRPGIGDVARTLMERRKKWIDSVGPVFEEGVGRVPKESVYEDGVMAALMEREREGWDEGEE